MVVSPQWRGSGNIHGFNLDGKSYQQGYASYALRFQCGDNNVELLCARQMEPRRQLGRRSHVLFLSN